VATARRLLVASGPGAVTLRAIAREMGMTAPGLYRYVASHEDLMSVLIAALYDELSDELEAARDAAGAGDAGSDPAVRLLATARAFRRWGLSHPTELGLVFGSPLPGYDAPADGVTHQAGRRFGSVFLGLFAEVWARSPFAVRPDADIDPGLAGELSGWLPPGFALPLGALEVFLRCWMRLYGAVVMEAFGQLDFAVLDAEPLFELELAALSDLLGTAYRPPEPAAR
jgi:AcrR family transcriptional regulator